MCPERGLRLPLVSILQCYVVVSHRGSLRLVEKARPHQSNALAVTQTSSPLSPREFGHGSARKGSGVERANAAAVLPLASLSHSIARLLQGGTPPLSP